MTQTPTTVLTPAQFVAARALAKAYNHLWSDVPDGTYDVNEIETIARAWQDPHLPAGIDCPDYSIDPLGNIVIEHTTGSGRLHWQALPSGNVRLEVYRPASCSQFAYGIEPWKEQDAVLVAIVDVLNDDDGKFTVTSDGIVLGTSEYEQCHNEDGQVKPGWTYFPAHERHIHAEVLFERHIHALVRPLVALLTAKQTKPCYEYPESMTDEEYEAEQEKSAALYEQYRREVIHPAIETAKQRLAPLFERALPDPFIRSSWFNQETGQYEYGEAPQTYWTRPDDGTGCMYVVHKSEQFPAESEKTAVHAVLLLQQKPEMNLVEAIRAAVESYSYRP